MIIGGARFATTVGISTMQAWCVDSLVSQELLEPSVALITVRDPDPFGWMDWPVQEVSLIFTTADTVDGDTITALTAEMPVLSAFLSV